jgi:hypothetical protein
VGVIYAKCESMMINIDDDRMANVMGIKENDGFNKYVICYINEMNMMNMMVYYIIL